MAPRSGGGRYIPDPPGPVHNGADQPDDAIMQMDGEVADPAQPPEQWQAPDGWSSAATLSERQLTVSTTILDATIPAAYGECRVTGLMGCRNIEGANDTSYKCGFVFCFGEQEFADGESDYQIQINGEDIDDLSWVEYDEHPGDGSTAISGKIDFMSAPEQTRWKSTVMSRLTST